MGSFPRRKKDLPRTYPREGGVLCQDGRRVQGWHSCRCQVRNRTTSAQATRSVCSLYHVRVPWTKELPAPQEAGTHCGAGASICEDGRVEVGQLGGFRDGWGNLREADNATACCTLSCCCTRQVFGHAAGQIRVHMPYVPAARTSLGSLCLADGRRNGLGEARSR